MQKSVSLEKVNGVEIGSNVKNKSSRRNISDRFVAPRRRLKPALRNIHEQYHITIKPKLCRSSSLSDLTANNSDFTLEYLKNNNQDISGKYLKSSHYNTFGDSAAAPTSTDPPYEYMSWTFKGKKPKKKFVMSPETPASHASDYRQTVETSPFSPVSSSADDNTSVSSLEHLDTQRGTTFPFKSTPSGNFKVQSNQVVFQSSTVGVLLADPTQAKVKVKFEGKEAGDPENEDGQDFINISKEPEPKLQFGPKEITNQNCQVKYNSQTERQRVREDKGKDLASLGYVTAEPVDWLRVQLPKKQDLMQEFYRRLHNYVNTDTVVHIGDEQFHCHHMVLEIYSTFFNMNLHREIELPTDSVTPDAFQTIYEWMIFSGPDSNKTLKRNNILDVFCAAQYLSIKDLEDQCWSFIVNENLFNEDTAFYLYREARVKGITPVVDLMVPRVMRFFLPLVASQDFLTLEPDEVMTFLRSNYVCVTSEIEVLMAGVRWLYGAWPARRCHCVEVMRCVRFGLISPWQLVDIKRNPDNAEILEIVNEPEVQQMVDDGLAYVIIKYWYGNNSKNYYHWIDVLGLSEPAERNWIGEEKNHVTYKDFLKYLEQFMVPRDKMYQHMAMLQPARRTDDNVPGSLRGMDEKMEMRRPKLDFPLPTTLKAFSGDKDKFPTMSEFFDSRKMAHEGSPTPGRSSPPAEAETGYHRYLVMQPNDSKPENISSNLEDLKKIQNKQNENVSSQLPVYANAQIFDPPEKDSAEELNTTNSETSSEIAHTTSESGKNYNPKHGERRQSVAACYLAAATAALSNTRTSLKPQTSPPRAHTTSHVSRPETSNPLGPYSQNAFQSPQISLFRQSKESIAKANMNKLSTSILGPSNKNYIADGSLFNWDRETVLVFGGIDPHTAYGVGRNTGKDIYKFDPVSNMWEYVGDLPEPRHHHSVAFLRGRVYLVGGADPRDDDIRGKSVVVSTVWSYEPVTKSWYSEAGLATPRKNFGLVVHRMALYAIGGQDKKGRVLRSVEKFDPKSGSWSEVRAMNVARMAVATTKYREYIWVAGGMTGEKKKPLCRVVECYNSKTNDWTEIHSLRFPRCFATLFAMNDKLYIVGGAGRLSEKDKSASSVGAIDVWDWKGREWKHQTDMSIPRHGHALAYLGTQLIIIGGVTTIYMRALNNVESFCCERSAWIRGVAALPSPLSGHGAVTLPPASLM